MEEERREKILQSYRNRGVQIKYSLMITDERTKEMSDDGKWMTQEQVTRFLASFKPEELKHFTIIGWSSLRFADADLSELNSRVFHQGVK